MGSVSKVVDSDKEFEKIHVSDGDNNEGNNTPSLASYDISRLKFEIGIIFTTRDELKKVFQNHVIHEKRGVKFTEIDLRRIYSMCGDGHYEWRIHVLKTFEGNF